MLVVGVSLLPEGEVVKVVAKVYYPNAWYLASKPLHASQKELRVENLKGSKDQGFKVFQWEVIPNEELVQALMVYADQMEVLEPEWVRLIERAKEIMAKNEEK